MLQYPYNEPSRFSMLLVFKDQSNCRKSLLHLVQKEGYSLKKMLVDISPQNKLDFVLRKNMDIVNVLRNYASRYVCTIKNRNGAAPHAIAIDIGEDWCIFNHKITLPLSRENIKQCCGYDPSGIDLFLRIIKNKK